MSEREPLLAIAQPGKSVHKTSYGLHAPRRPVKHPAVMDVFSIQPKKKVLPPHRFPSLLASTSYVYSRKRSRKQEKLEEAADDLKVMPHRQLQARLYGLTFLIIVVYAIQLVLLKLLLDKLYDFRWFFAMLQFTFSGLLAIAYAWYHYSTSLSSSEKALGASWRMLLHCSVFKEVLLISLMEAIYGIAICIIIAILPALLSVLLPSLSFVFLTAINGNLRLTSIFSLPRSFFPGSSGSEDNTPAISAGASKILFRNRSGMLCATVGLVVLVATLAQLPSPLISTPIISPPAQTPTHPPAPSLYSSTPLFATSSPTAVAVAAPPPATDLYPLHVGLFLAACTLGSLATIRKQRLLVKQQLHASWFNLSVSVLTLLIGLLLSPLALHLQYVNVASPDLLDTIIVTPPSSAPPSAADFSAPFSTVASSPTQFSLTPSPQRDSRSFDTSSSSSFSFSALVSSSSSTSSFFDADVEYDDVRREEDHRIHMPNITLVWLTPAFPSSFTQNIASGWTCLLHGQDYEQPSSPNDPLISPSPSSHQGEVNATAVLPLQYPPSQCATPYLLPFTIFYFSLFLAMQLLIACLASLVGRTSKVINQLRRPSIEEEDSLEEKGNTKEKEGDGELDGSKMRIIKSSALELPKEEFAATKLVQSPLFGPLVSPSGPMLTGHFYHPLDTAAAEAAARVNASLAKMKNEEAKLKKDAEETKPTIPGKEAAVSSSCFVLAPTWSTVVSQPPSYFKRPSISEDSPYFLANYGVGEYSGHNAREFIKRQQQLELARSKAEEERQQQSSSSSSSAAPDDNPNRYNEPKNGTTSNNLTGNSTPSDSSHHGLSPYSARMALQKMKTSYFYERTGKKKGLSSMGLSHRLQMALQLGAFIAFFSCLTLHWAAWGELWTFKSASLLNPLCAIPCYKDGRAILLPSSSSSSSLPSSPSSSREVMDQLDKKLAMFGGAKPPGESGVFRAFLCGPIPSPNLNLWKGQWVEQQEAVKTEANNYNKGYSRFTSYSCAAEVSGEKKVDAYRAKKEDEIVKKEEKAMRSEEKTKKKGHPLHSVVPSSSSASDRLEQIQHAPRRPHIPMRTPVYSLLFGAGIFFAGVIFLHLTPLALSCPEEKGPHETGAYHDNSSSGGSSSGSSSQETPCPGTQASAASGSPAGAADEADDEEDEDEMGLPSAFAASSISAVVVMDVWARIFEDDGLPLIGLAPYVEY